MFFCNNETVLFPLFGFGRLRWEYGVVLACHLIEHRSVCKVQAVR